MTGFFLGVRHDPLHPPVAAAPQARRRNAMSTPESWVEYAARRLEREQRRERILPPMTWAGEQVAAFQQQLREMADPITGILHIEFPDQPTFHYKEADLPDGTIVRWPVLDGPLPPPV